MANTVPSRIIAYGNTSDSMMDLILQHAEYLAHKFIIVDGHIDLPWRLSLLNFRPEGEFLNLPIQSKEGDFDYVRAKKGGLSAAFMAIYIPASFQSDLKSAKAEADSLIAMIQSIIAAHPDKFAAGFSPEIIEDNFSKGLISLPMGLENGAPIASLDDVDYFYEQGIRYVTLTHGKDNHICDSSYDSMRTWNGLSPFGKQVIEKMNDSGMIIDVSHISDAAYEHVMELSRVPVLATHSSCRAFTPGWERNMSDEMIKLLGKKNGVIQINFGSDFLDANIAKSRAQRKKELQRRLDAAEADKENETAKSITSQFKRKYPDLYADVKMVADHFDHVRKLVGIDHLGIGSDYDGLGDSLPEGLKDVSTYPNLIAELLSRGYSDDDIEKICYKNVWRVWNDVNAYAMKS
ncbi:MAG: dipeptidase [Bacteroidota bacterium]|nr:dipeptidase [Bacteroidota bacterium]